MYNARESVTRMAGISATPARHLLDNDVSSAIVAALVSLIEISKVSEDYKEVENATLNTKCFLATKI